MTVSSISLPRRAIYFTLLIFLVIYLDFLFFPRTLEDAFITFRYSKHLLQGYGLGAWNTCGEIVEGYTSFLWMILMSPAESLGITHATLSKIFGMATHLGLVLLCLTTSYFIHTKSIFKEFTYGKDRDVLFLTATILATYIPIAFYATSGMETVAFSLLVLACFLTPYFTDRISINIFIAILTVIMRPEGVLVAMACGFYHLLRQKKEGQNIKNSIAGLSAAILVTSALMISRKFMFGEWLPNTYYAKAGSAGLMHWNIGWDYISHWIQNHPIWVVLYVIVLGITIRNWIKRGFYSQLSPLFLLTFTLGYSLYIIKVGGDNHWAFPAWRHVIHMMPLLALLISYGFVTLLKFSRSLTYAAVILSVIFTNYKIVNIRYSTLLTGDFYTGLSTFPNLKNSTHSPYYYFIKNISESNTVIASLLGGELPFVVDAIHIDMLGLNDKFIAHNGTFDPEGPIDSKTDLNYILAQQPDIIEGYLSGNKILQAIDLKDIITGRRKLVMEMIKHPIFQLEYMFLENGPYNDIDRALFLHRSFWENHPQRDSLQCIPITVTCLNRP